MGALVVEKVVNSNVGVPPTQEQSTEPGYKGYLDYFDVNYEYKGTRYLNIEDLKIVGLIESN